MPVCVVVRRLPLLISWILHLLDNFRGTWIKSLTHGCLIYAELYHFPPPSLKYEVSCLESLHYYTVILTKPPKHIPFGSANMTLPYTLLWMFVCRHKKAPPASPQLCAGYSLTNCGSPVMRLWKRYALLLPVPTQAHALSWKVPCVYVRDDAAKLFLHTFFVQVRQIPFVCALSDRLCVR